MSDIVARYLSSVMPALGAGIHAFPCRQGVDGRDKPGHDGGGLCYV
jgi:hypothetical protein